MTDNDLEIVFTDLNQVQPASLGLPAAQIATCHRLQPQEYDGSPPAQIHVISKLGSHSPLQQYHVGSNPPALATPTLHLPVDEISPFYHSHLHQYSHQSPNIDVTAASGGTFQHLTSGPAITSEFVPAKILKTTCSTAYPTFPSNTFPTQSTHPASITLAVNQPTIAAATATSINNSAPPPDLSLSMSYAESMVTTSTQPAMLQVKHKPASSDSYPHPPIFGMALPPLSTQSALSYPNGTTSYRPIPPISPISPMSTPAGSVHSFTSDSKTQDLTCVNNWPSAIPFSPIYPAQLPQPRKRRFRCACLYCLNGINSEADKKQHICHYPDCGKIYGRTDQLKVHIRKYHTGEKPFICNWPYCDKRFARSSELHRHFRTHTGESSQYICEECNKCYQRKDYLTSHKKIHQKMREQQSCATPCGSPSSSDYKEPPNTPSSISSPLPEQPPIPSEDNLFFTERDLGDTATAAITGITDTSS